MNRIDFQMIAHARLAEAEHLLKAGSYSGAYYLAGYVIECALKACIAKSTQQHDFPDRTKVENSHSHDLKKLLQIADLESQLKAARRESAKLGHRWDTVQEWNERSRYSIWSYDKAESILRRSWQPRRRYFPMADSVLVGFNVADGEKAVKAIKQAGIFLAVALWAKTSDYDCRVFSSPRQTSRRTPT